MDIVDRLRANIDRPRFLVDPDCHEAADLITRLRRERDEARAAMTWQPIETAPKDKTGFLAYWRITDTHWAFAICYWNSKGVHGEGWYTVDLFSDEFEHVIQPTHWMPLPTQEATK